MPTHAEKRILPYTPQQMYDLVADVESYPAFLPWCADCRITSKRGNKLKADLTVGYKIIRETFTSEVMLDPDEMTINVKYLNGPFKYLNNHWKFVPKNRGKSCELDFYIDFEFKSGLLQKAMTIFFNEAVKRMIAAFESRAAEIYS